MNQDATVAKVRVGGAIDLAAEAALARVVEQLRTVASPIVLVDLGEVTFACSTLINFLISVRNALPEDTELVISRTTTQTRRLLTLAGLASVTVLDDGRSIAA